jgi:hypothetical protein
MDLPLRDIDDLQPVFAAVLLYVVVLVVLRLFLWPFLMGLRKRNFLGKLLAFLATVLLRVLFLGGLALAAFWALWVLGLEEGLVNFVVEIPNMNFEDINLIILGAFVLLLILLWFFAIRPALGFLRSRR